MQISDHASPPPSLKHLQIENHNMIISFRYKIKFLGVTGKKKLEFPAAFVKDNG